MYGPEANMPFLLSDDEDLIAKTVAEFAAGIGADAAHEFDRHGTFPAEPLAGAAQLGLLGMSLSAEQGGAGVSPAAYALAVMEMAKVCPNTATVLAAHNGAAMRLLADGPEALRAQGAASVIATLATEEAYGSDKSTIGTEAAPDGDGFRLTGSKVWGVGATDATTFLILAQAPDGPTWFAVPRDAPGIQVAAPEDLLGLRAAGISNVYLDDVAVGADAIVGAPGQGKAMWDAVQPWLQVGAAACIVGAAVGAQLVGNDFAENRVQFGKPIGTYQAVSDTLTEIDIQIAAARSLVLEAASRLAHDDAPAWAARAKAFAAGMAILSTRRVIRVQGGTGFMREGGSERYARDVRALQFFGEPVVMQRDTLKRHLLDIDFGQSP